MADSSLSDISYNQYSKKELGAGRTPIDKAKWMSIHGAKSAEAPKKEGPDEKFWDVDTMDRYNKYKSEREKGGKKAIDLNVWAPINEGKHMK